MAVVGFDISALDEAFKEHSKRGIGRYVRELNAGFDEQTESGISIARFDHRSLVTNSSLGKIFDFSPIGRTTLKQQFVYPLSMKSRDVKDIDIFHFPAHMDAPSWGRSPYILTVLDLIPQVFPDLYRADKPNWRYSFARWLENKSIKNATKILAISEATARDIERVLDIASERIIVTPLGVDSKFFNAQSPENVSDFRESLGIPENRPVLLYVGGIDQRKNWITLLKTLKAVKEICLEQGKEIPVLVMAGSIFKDRQYPKLTSQIAELELHSDVVMPGYVPDQDLLKLYKISDVFCFLSLYEGFGLPVLEAMAAGLPVVCSNTSSIPEVAGQACALVCPTDVNAACDKILRIISDSEYASSLSEAGIKQAEKFPWSRTVDLTMRAYETCLSGLRRAA